MKKLLLVIFIILLLGCLICYVPTKNGKQQEKRLDTIVQINNGDSLFFVVNENNETIDWWGYSMGVPVSKGHFEKLKRIADTLIELGYRKGCLNDN